MALPNHLVSSLQVLPIQIGIESGTGPLLLGQQGATEFLDAFVRAVQIALAGYGRSGRHFVQLAVGCTGGKHRSVVMADQMAARLSFTWPGIQVTHRDLGRE